MRKSTLPRVTTRGVSGRGAEVCKTFQKPQKGLTAVSSKIREGERDPELGVDGEMEARRPSEGRVGRDLLLSASSDKEEGGTMQRKNEHC